MSEDPPREAADAVDSHSQRLQSSSTNTQIDVLGQILQDVENATRTRANTDDGAQPPLKILPALLATYPRNFKRRPRKLVQSCLRAFLRQDSADKTHLFLGKFLQQESQKVAVAPTNAFVLLEWCTAVQEELIALETLAEPLYSQTCSAAALLLDKCLALEVREGLQHAAVVVARRGARKVLHSKHGSNALESAIKTLTSGSAAVPAYSSYLGLIGAVSSKIERRQEQFRDHSHTVLDFYVKSILSSKSPLPQQQSTGLNEVLAIYVSQDKASSVLVPAVEKALLRSPESILQGPLVALAQSLSPHVDLSGPLSSKLLKPLISSMSSTNAAIRDGAGQALNALLVRRQDASNLETITEEIIAQIRSAKAASYELRGILSDSLRSVSPAPTLSGTIVQGLVTTAAKEANETACRREILAAAHHLPLFTLSDKPDPSVFDAVLKGCAEKRAPFRKAWVLGVGTAFLQIDRLPDTPPARSFVFDFIRVLQQIHGELSSNPLPATQAGTIPMAFVLPALCDAAVMRRYEEHESPKESSDSIAEAAVHPQSFLVNPKVYTRLTAVDDQHWALRALLGVSRALETTAVAESQRAWGRALLHLMLARESTAVVRKETSNELAQLYLRQPSSVGQSVVRGLWELLAEEAVDQRKVKPDDAVAKLPVRRAITCISPPKHVWQAQNLDYPRDVLDSQAVSLVVLLGPELVPATDWIDNCLTIGVDPGRLAQHKTGALLEQLLSQFHPGRMSPLTPFELAACRAASVLSFVSPDVFLPSVVGQIASDLDSRQLDNVGTVEATIARAPEGVMVVDPNAKTNGFIENKNVKDYDTLKWEEEVRSQLAKKKGAPQKKLTPDQQAKVDAQVKHEQEVRERVKTVSSRLQRGAGFVNALAKGPPTDSRQWMSPAIGSLEKALRRGAALVTDDTLAQSYLACSDKVVERLGVMRPFIGIATLRAIGSLGLPSDLDEEPLSDLTIRVLYRLRFASEQRPLDTPSLAYALPLIFAILDSAGVGSPANSEDAESQVLLALEFLSYQMGSCSDVHLPRVDILKRLITSMQRYPQHYRLIKDALLELASAISESLVEEERDVLLESVTLADVSTRSAVLQAIQSELHLSGLDHSVDMWIACQDEEEENADTALAIWEENGFSVTGALVDAIPAFLYDQARSTRTSAAKALAQSLTVLPEKMKGARAGLEESYRVEAQPLVPRKDKFGIVQRGELIDRWERRSGLALAFRSLAPVLAPGDLLPTMEFLVNGGALSDRHYIVRQEMLEAGIELVTVRGDECLEPFMKLFEGILQGPDKATQEADWLHEAVIVLYGSIARHLPRGDSRLKAVLSKLVETLGTPSESVQYAVANCLPPLVRAAGKDADSYFGSLLENLFGAKQYAARRGAAYGLAGIVKGKGIAALRQFRVMSSLKSATEDKKSADRRQGALFAYELLSLVMGKTFEPYVVDVLPQLLACFGDPSAPVREACLDTAKTCFSSLSSYGVQQVLPQLLEGLDETQWRSKKGACDLLGAMAYLDPQQLAVSLPDIIPPLTAVLTDSHKEVRAAANNSLKRFGEVINNPEVKSLVDILLKALSDPTKHTEDALDGLIKVSFIHYLDSPSLALIVRILERGLNDRSSTKRKAAQIIGSLAHLTEKRDIVTHLPILVSGLRLASVDPVPATRATASKALGSLVEKLGEDAFPDLIPSLMSSLRTDTGAGDRLGSAQALSEVLAGLGTGRLEETLPTILQNVGSTRPTVREGFMTLFIFLPACFGNVFANYLAQIIPSVLSGLADDVEAIRDIALRAGRLLVKNFASKSIDLLLPELQRGLADDSYRIRLSSVELVGDLLFNLTGISAKTEAEEGDETAIQAGQSLLEVLGEERRNRVLSSLYICRCDTSGLVRAAAIAVWKALVATPRTLRDIVPTLTQIIIARLGSSNPEQKHIAANALGEVIRKAGESIFTTLLPSLEEGLETATDPDHRQGICIALREVVTAAQPETLEDNEKKLIGIVRIALVDSFADVRDAAAESFDALQNVFGKRAVDQILPHLLNLLRDDDEAENALAALLTLLTEQMRANAILPNLIPTLITNPISAFNARALASLARVGGAAMNRRLPTILNTLADNIVGCRDGERKVELESAFDTVLCSVDEYDGLNTAMSVMLAMMKHDDHHKRAVAARQLATFCARYDEDYSRYNQDLIRVFLISFDDRDKNVVTAAWSALSALQGHLRKEEMESLTASTTQVLRQVGTPGHNLPGFLLPKGMQPVMQILLQGLMNGTSDLRLHAANGISDMIDKSSPESLKPFVTQLTGPLIRVVSERSIDVKCAIIFALNQLLEKIPTFLRPFLPQLQRTFTKCIADPTSDVLRNRAIKALSTLITLTPRVDPLIAELVTGAKTTDTGVRNAMLKALQEVVSRVGGNMSETSRDTILGLVDSQNAEADEMMVTMSRLLGAMIKVLPEATASGLVKSRVLVQPPTNASILGLNAVLAESHSALTDSFLGEVRTVIVAGLESSTFIQHNAILALGKLLLADTPSDPGASTSVPSNAKSGPPTIEATDANRAMLQLLGERIRPGNDIDSRRLALVVTRTVSRHHNEPMRPYITYFVLPIYQSLRDPVIPVKLAAEAAFLQLFDAVDSETAVFDEYVASDDAKKAYQPPILRAFGEYFKRIGVRLANQKREQREAEGGAKGGERWLSSDEVEDEREVWSVGKVDLGESAFND